MIKNVITALGNEEGNNIDNIPKRLINKGFKDRGFKLMIGMSSEERNMKMYSYRVRLKTSHDHLPPYMVTI